MIRKFSCVWDRPTVILTTDFSLLPFFRSVELATRLEIMVFRFPGASYPHLHSKLWWHAVNRGEILATSGYSCRDVLHIHIANLGKKLRSIWRDLEVFGATVHLVQRSAIIWSATNHLVCPF